jgi:DNA-binding PadR family transcriptional regulator
MHHGRADWPPRPPFARARKGEFGQFFGPDPRFSRYGRARRGMPSRARRGDVRAAILLLLSERPMHGYEIISELQARTAGVWSPSPGSVYPTLQLLEDEGLVTSVEADGKRRFALSEAGEQALGALGDAPPPWEEVLGGVDPAYHQAREAGLSLMSAVRQVMRSGSPTEVGDAAGILDEARRRIYALLAEEPKPGAGTAATGTPPA